MFLWLTNSAIVAYASISHTLTLWKLYSTLLLFTLPLLSLVSVSPHLRDVQTNQSIRAALGAVNMVDGGLGEAGTRILPP